MKNSLCLFMQSIEGLVLSMVWADPKSRAHLVSSHYDAAGLNTGLVQ
ncbi:hypothetical protein [uncultured Paraglaciecola sp.]|nr:hypothetical protein [uncultured Paraglaciecola sp.]